MVVLAVRNVTGSVIAGPEAYAFTVVTWLLIVVLVLVRLSVLAFRFPLPLPLPFPWAMICAMTWEKLLALARLEPSLPLPFRGPFCLSLLFSVEILATGS